MYGFIIGLLNPQWFTPVKKEADKVSTFGKKLEHVLVDLNSIRDVIYGTKLKEVGIMYNPIYPITLYTLYTCIIEITYDTLIHSYHRIL